MLKNRITLGAFSLLLAFGTVAFAQGPYDIVNVPKVAGIQWFNRMDEGVKQFAKDTGNNAFQVGPAQADAAQQVQIIEDMIAQKVDAITVVPFAPEALEPVLKRAMDAGIVVISHEASNLQNVNWDVEAFNNADYGRTIMENLAECMGGEGEYAVFVGSLTSETHNQWVDAAIALQKEKYPNMTLVGDKNETNDDQQTAYARAQEILRAFPNIKGFQGSASTDVPGIALAVEERGLEDRTCNMGTSLPSIASQYLETGAADKIFFWDPALAGIVMNKLAVMVLEDQPIEAGADLGVDGYNDIKIDGKVIYGQAWVIVDKDNMDQYPF